MTFKFIITPTLEKVLNKLAHKDRTFALAIRKKMIQIINSNMVFINHFKNLRGDLSEYKRVHVGSFVLMFKVEKDTIIFDRFRHHDEAY